MSFYVYLDNFRGFSDTLFPIEKMNFLVGENSTGKSSILSLISILAAGRHINPEDEMQEVFGCYDDIVSAASSNKENFRIGYCFIKDTEGDNQIETRGCVFVFGEKDGLPHLEYYSQEIKSSRFDLIFKNKRSKTIKYRIESLTTENCNSVENAEENYRHFAKTSSATTLSGFHSLDKNLREGLPPALYLNFAFHGKKNTQDTSIDDHLMGIPLLGIGVSESGPVRSAPKKFYLNLHMSHMTHSRTQAAT